MSELAGQPTASGILAEVVSTVLFAKRSGGWPGQPATIGCPDPLSLTRNHRGLILGRAIVQY